MWPSVRDSSMVSNGVSGVSMSWAERLRERSGTILSHVLL